MAAPGWAEDEIRALVGAKMTPSSTKVKTTVIVLPFEHLLHKDPWSIHSFGILSRYSMIVCFILAGQRLYMNGLDAGLPTQRTMF